MPSYLCLTGDVLQPMDAGCKHFVVFDLLQAIDELSVGPVNVTVAGSP